MEISNIEALRSGILDLTGGMNFYNTNIEISNLEISNSLAEDALNIINGELNIKNTPYINMEYFPSIGKYRIQV